MSPPSSPAHSKSDETMETQPSRLAQNRCVQGIRSRKSHEANQIETFQLDKYNKLGAEEVNRAEFIFKRLQILPERYLESMESGEIETFASLMTKAYPWCPLNALVIKKYRLLKLKGKVLWLTKFSRFVKWWEDACHGPLKTDIMSAESTVFDVGDKVDKPRIGNLGTRVPFTAHDTAETSPHTAVTEDAVTKDAPSGNQVATGTPTKLKRARAESTSSVSSNNNSSPPQHKSSPQTSPESLRSQTPTSLGAEEPEVEDSDKQTSRKKRKHEAISTTQSLDPSASIEIIDLSSPTYDANTPVVDVQPVHSNQKPKTIKRETTEDKPAKRPRPRSPSNADAKDVKPSRRIRIKKGSKKLKK